MDYKVVVTEDAERDLNQYYDVSDFRVLFGTADLCCSAGYNQSGKMKLVNKIRRKAILQKSEDVPRRISA